MRLLLDTHVMLWALTGDKRLGKAKALILEPSNEVSVSAASYVDDATMPPTNRRPNDAVTPETGSRCVPRDDLPVGEVFGQQRSCAASRVNGVVSSGTCRFFVSSRAARIDRW